MNCLLGQYRCIKIIQIMSVYPTPRSMSSHNLRRSKPTLTTLNLHQGMNNSSYYKAILDNHFKAASTQSHVLSCANSKYSKGFRSRSLHASRSKSAMRANPEAVSVIYEEGSPKDVMGAQIHRLFEEKLESKPMIERDLRIAQQEKQNLENLIAKLKKNINAQKQGLDKINLSCSSLQNQIYLTKRETDKVRDTNRDLEVQNQALSIECQDLHQQLTQTQAQNALKRKRVHTETQLRDELLKIKEASQIELRRQSKQFNKLKEVEIRDIRKLLGTYELEGRLGGEKALLLNEIDSNYCRAKGAA